MVLTTLMLALVVVAPAQAGRRWCEADPVFLVAGTQVNVITAILEEHQPAVTGPVAVTLYVPPDVSAILISTDAGYNGFGEVVSIIPTPDLSVKNRRVEVLVEVTVPASLADMPVTVFVTHDGARTKSVKGTSNGVVPVQLKVDSSS